MRCTVTMIAAALAMSACAQSPGDDATDDVFVEDTVEVGAANGPSADAQSAGDRADADDGAGVADDGSDVSSDGTASDGEDATGGNVATTIPSSFHGEWNGDRAACGTGQSETRLRVSGDRIRFYESVGAVREVDIESDRSISVTAEYQGEGNTWEDERRLTLSEDGSSLTVSGGGDLVRYRCP